MPCDQPNANLDVKKILETERLVLREIDPVADAAFMLELLNEPAFIRYVADRGVRTTEAASAYITEKILPSYAKFGFGFYIVELKESSARVGICGLVKRDTLEDVDIGFSTTARYWGRGYAYEAAAALMAHGRDVHGLKRIVGITARGNQASMNLLQKLGLRFERMVQVPGFADESQLFT